MLFHDAQSMEVIGVLVWLDIIGGSRGGAAGAHPPNRIQFFCFCIHFCQKVPTSEVGAPPNGSVPPPQWEILDPPLDMAPYWMPSVQTFH